jgi:hypothetical protein
MKILLLFNDEVSSSTLVKTLATHNKKLKKKLKSKTLN